MCLLNWSIRVLQGGRISIYRTFSNFFSGNFQDPFLRFLPIWKESESISYRYEFIWRKLNVSSQLVDPRPTRWTQSMRPRYEPHTFWNSFNFGTIWSESNQRATQSPMQTTIGSPSTNQRPIDEVWSYLESISSNFLRPFFPLSLTAVTVFFYLFFPFF